MVRTGAVCIVLLLAVVAVPVSAAVYFTSSAPGIITKGDTLTVSGTGAVNGTVGIWIIGRDHFEVLTAAADRNGNFSLMLKPSATDQFSSGRYVILFQDPGADGIMEIEGGTDLSGNISVMNRGKIITRLGPREDLGENIRAVTDQVLSTASLPGIDDSFLAEFFFVEEPAIFFTRIIPATGFQLPDKTSGERIVIPGTTNIGTDNTLITTIRAENTNEIVTTKTIPVIAGDPMNTWTWELDTPGLPPGDYDITVTSTRFNITANASFMVKNPVPSSVSPDKTMPPGPLPQGNDYTFPVFVAATLIVLAIVLYYAGRG